jgi:SAM-dependent methyltransferase
LKAVRMMSFPRKVLLLGSAPYLPLWWSLNGSELRSDGYAVVCINNAWKILEGELPEYWIHPSDYATTSPKSVQPSSSQVKAMTEVTHREYDRIGPIQVAKVDGGTMLLNALQFILNSFFAAESGQQFTLLIAGCDLDYTGGRHFYQGGRADPLRKGLTWIKDELTRIKKLLESSPHITVQNAGYSTSSVLPFERYSPKMPGVSICTVIHNRSNLHKAQTASLGRSALNWRGHLELCIADFHSDDTDWQYLELLPFPVKRVCLDGCFSLGRGRNESACMATHETILFLDADMLLPPDFFCTLVPLVSAGVAAFPIYEREVSPGGPLVWGQGWGNVMLPASIWRGRVWIEHDYWGGEDNDMAQQLRDVLPIWRERLPGFIHQWHEKDSASNVWYRKPPPLPPHLGGHFGVSHTDPGALTWLHARFGVKSMLDIGCGPGRMEEVARRLGIAWHGVDGDPGVCRPSVTTHDFSLGRALALAEIDLAWSTEFVEHVEERHIPNFMNAFQKARLVCLTHALPDTPGHHHVNCRVAAYWIAVFRAFGFDLDAEATAAVRKASTMKRGFMRDTGLVFLRKNGPAEDKSAVSAA